MQDTPLNLIGSGCDMSRSPPELVVNTTVVNRARFSSKYLLVAGEPYLRKRGPLQSLCDVSRHRIVDGREISLGVQYQRSASLPRRVRTFVDACPSYFRAVGAAHDMDAHGGESAAAPNPSAHDAIG